MKYEEIVKATNEIISQYDFNLTVRQIYYRLASDPYCLVKANRSGYNSFDRMLVKAREKGDVDENRIEDRHRQEQGGDFGFKSIDDFLASQLQRLAKCYKIYSKPLWENQDQIIEVWVEKDALSQVIGSIANRYNVLTFPTKGYSSYTKVRQGIARLKSYPGKRLKILLFVDHDPSGIDMVRDLQDRFMKYGGGDIEIEKIALTFDQVKRYNLLPNPVKKADTKARKYIELYGKECWELDAIPPNELRRIVTEAIQRHIDIDKWNERIAEIEKEREEIKKKLNEWLQKIGYDT